MACNVPVPGMSDEQEMLRLMNEHGAHLIGMCTLLLHDAFLAQDVVQETFLRAWRKGRLIRETERAWLTRVAVNLCRDEQRSRWFRHVDRRITPEELPGRAGCGQRPPRQRPSPARPGARGDRDALLERHGPGGNCRDAAHQPRNGVPPA